jgi:photosystem I subunit 3
MRRLFALAIAFVLWFSVVPSASAAEVSGLVPCRESAAFQERAQTARNTTADPESGKKRFERYADALCGPEGLPHLIVDGRLSHAGDFLIPSIAFLYITGAIGWSGRTYLQAIKKGSSPEQKEIILDLPLAISSMIGSAAWPLAALAEFSSGKLTANDNEINVSPR